MGGIKNIWSSNTIFDSNCFGIDTSGSDNIIRSNCVRANNGLFGCDGVGRVGIRIGGKSI